MSELASENLSAQGLEAFLLKTIPLTRAMGVRVVESNAHRLVVTAPLSANVNHLGTAFGGSLHALPTLACYAGLWTLLREVGIAGHIVVKRSQAVYRQPVTADLRAVWERPAPAVVKDFVRNLRRYKKARLELSAIVEGAHGRPAVEFHGSFVAVL